MALLWAWFACACLFIVLVTGDGVEDFAFDSDSPTEPLHRLWGIPDTSANVGQLFHFAVPANAFSGIIVRYQARGALDRLLPEWLNFDERSGLFEGVPGEVDIGEHYVAVEAIDANMKDRIRDVFAIDVTHNSIPKEKCKPSEDSTVLTLVLDKAFEDIDSKHKVTAIKNLAGFLGLHWSNLSLFPQSPEAELLSEAVVLAGPGNVKKKQAAGSTVILWQVGCDGAVWNEQTRPLDELKQNARDGTLAEVLQLPVIGWHGSIAAEIGAARERRQVVAGSGELDSEWEEEPPQRIIPSLASPVFPSSSHPHRHHHGDYVEVLPSSTTTPSPASQGIPYGSIMATPTLIPERPTSLFVETLTATPGFEYVLTPTPSRTLSIEPTPSAIPETTPSATSTTTTQIETKAESVSLPTETSLVIDMTTTTEQTTPSLLQGSTASSGEDEVEYETKNFPPTIQHRIRKQAVTAGKPLRLVIPEDTFTDLEDGNTRNLQLNFKTQEGAAVPPLSWIQFNPKSQEIYALPLEEQVSKWVFEVSATDSDGASVSDGLEVLVQHHKGRRTVTHAITLELELGTPARSLPSPVDWQLRLIDRLATLYGDADDRLVTVLAINLTAQPVTFTFTNDSLPRNHCPTQQIQDNIKVLSDGEGQPVRELNRLLEPLVSVQRVVWQGLGQCEARQPEPPPPQLTNYPPVTRNQVDQLNATIGQLLLYTVPEDSFYDPEDGSTRNLKLSLMTMDRTPIHPTHWLQFDVKNQEFYGIPSTTGRTEYQLVCEDSGGLMANDGLVVVVQPAPKAPYNVEFRMTLGVEYETFMMSPATQRHFVERLAELFGDPDTGAIVLSGFSPSSTLVIWHNRTLPTDVCPDNEINRLRQVLIGEDERVSVAAARVMGPELPVLSAGLTPIGMCQGALTEVHETGVAGGGNEVRPVAGTSGGDHYLVTLVVPAVVIAAMLVCAGLVACVLYRRRSTGKMSVGDEDERHSFRSKGIPVIFQDELEERPEPTNKSPVIMKEEKPPLPPPEYQRTLPSATTALLSDTEDCPYQPPPPFTSSRDSARPKPTPTYRMPPPYVPP